ncbi:OmpA family protein [bacterium]|nr:OmpA family protein [candidate division CSSED10-310 bacterium]
MAILPTGCKRQPEPGPVEDTPAPYVAPTPTPKPEAVEPAITEEELRRRYEEEKERTLQDVNFDFDRWNLSIRARALLSAVGDWLLSNADVKLLIEGHCDERGSSEYNLALGQKRANAAKEYLVDFGIAGDRLSTISYGEERPLDPRSTEDAWSLNRRAHFVVIEE